MKRKLSDRPFQPWQRNPGDSVPVTIYLPPHCAQIFEELHTKVAANLRGYAERVLDEQLRLALCRYHSIVGWRNLGYGDSSSYWEEAIGKPELKLVT